MQQPFLRLAKHITLQKLYPDQNIYFLIWILKNLGCDLYIKRLILEAPFTIITKYFENGLIESVSTFANGRRHGLECSWYDAIQMRHHVGWKNDKKHGLELMWHALSGPLLGQVNWKDGKQHGMSAIYDGDGKLMTREYWSFGKMISQENI